MDKKYQITKNVIYNFAGQFVLLALGFFTTPFIIHRLGNESYGILVIVTAVVGYFSILDLGLGVSVIKFLADYHAKKDKKSIEKIIGTALTAYIIIGLVGALLITIFAQTLASKFLNISPSLIPVAVMVFYVSALGFLINMVLAVFHAVPAALQRMDILNTRNIFFGVLNTFGIIALLFFGYSLLAVVIWSVAVSAVATVAFLVIILRLLPGFSIRPRFDKSTFLKLLRFGSFKSLSNIFGQVVFQLDRLLIGIFLPISAVTFYTAPVNLVQKGLSAVLNITNAVFPAMSASHAVRDIGRVKDLYLRMSKFIVFIIFPLMTILFIFSDLIINLWLGPEFVSRSSPVLKILAPAYFIAAISSPGVVAADALNKPQIATYFAGASALINLSAALILIPNFGIEGAAWALLINFLAQVPIFMVVVHSKLIKISNLEVISLALVKPVSAGFLASLVSLMLISQLDTPVLQLFLGLIIFGFTYLLANLLLGTFDEKDRVAIYFGINKIKKIAFRHDKS